MKTPAEYLKDIVNQKKALIKTLEDRGTKASESDSLESLITKVEQLNTTCFYSSKDEIVINAKGNGVIRVICEEEIQEKELNEDTYTEITLENIESREKIYFIENINNITELDISNNGITKFLSNEENKINRFVIHNNLLNELDVSNFKEIQFLHMFTNPLCDEDAYKENLIATINSLPDRTDKAMGSIIFYPWYGLETLIEEIDGKYYKYPYLPNERGNVNHPNNPNRNFVYDDNGSYKFYANKLYGVVSNGDIVYYTRNADNTALENHTIMNYHHQTRKTDLEPLSLVKNWLFGSAIMYEPDVWGELPWDFKLNNIADMWETAEKGFGKTIGSFDHHAGRGTLFLNDDGEYTLDCNIYEYITCESNVNQSTYIKNPEEPLMLKHIPQSIYGNGTCDRDDKFPNVWGHGDFIVSCLASRHGNNRMGLCPNAKLLLIDRYYTNMPGRDYLWPNNTLATYQEMADKCDSITISYTFYSSSQKPSVDTIKTFAQSHIFTASGGNSGNNIQYDTENEGKLWPSAVYQVTALCSDNSFAPFSSSSPDEHPQTSYISYYGSNLAGYDTYNDKLRSASGTSYSSPLCNAYLTLLQIIYDKMCKYTTIESTFDGFNNYMKTHWINPISHLMDNAVGIGMPNVLADKDGFTSDRLINSKLDINADVEYGKTILPTQYTPFTINYKDETNGVKSGVTFVQDRENFIISKDGVVYPIKNGNQSLIFYSNAGVNSEEYASPIQIIKELDINSSISELKIKTSINSELKNNMFIDEEVFALSSPDLIKDNMNFTIMFYANIIYPSPIANSNSMKDLCFFKSKECAGELDCYTTADTKSVITNQGFALRFPNCKCVRHLPKPIQKLTSKNYLNIQSGTNVVIALRFDNTGITVFCDGVYILKTHYTYKDDTISIKDVGVCKDVLYTQDEQSVYFYNELLSDEEIIENSIAIKNNVIKEESV